MVVEGFFVGGDEGEVVEGLEGIDFFRSGFLFFVVVDEPACYVGVQAVGDYVEEVLSYASA